MCGAGSRGCAFVGLLSGVVCCWGGVWLGGKVGAVDGMIVCLCQW